MRDDVKQIFSVILKLLADKLSHLQELRRSQHSKQTLLKNGDMSGLVDRVEEDTHLMMMIDAANPEIAAAKKRICDICGIDYPEFDSVFKNVNADESARYTTLEKECLVIQRELLDLNSSLEEELVKALNSTKNDIESISRIRTLRRMLEKHDNGI